MKSMKVTLWAFILFAFFSSCSDDTFEVFSGISINGNVTKIVLTPTKSSKITNTSFKLATTVTQLDPNLPVKQYGYVWSVTNTSPTIANQLLLLGTNMEEPIDFPDTTIVDLVPNTVYYVRAYMTTVVGTGYGNVLVVKTLNSPADVVVINEGNYGSADGTLSLYNSLTNQATLGAFTSANGFPIAGIIQNGVDYDGKFYLVTNSANKVEVIDASTLLSTGVIKSNAYGTFATPYGFGAVGNKGFITDWGIFNNNTYSYDNPAIFVVDLTANTITGSITPMARPQNVQAVGERVFITNVGSNSISVINPESATIDTTYVVGEGPDDMVVDKNNKLWIICNEGKLVRIDPETDEIEAEITGVQVAGFNEKLVINTAGDKLYYLYAESWPLEGGFVYEMDITATVAPADPLIKGLNFYGLGISPSNVIYVSDANAFQGNGSVIRYTAQGDSLNAFAAGRGPNGFLFR